MVAARVRSDVESNIISFPGSLSHQAHAMPLSHLLLKLDAAQTAADQSSAEMLISVLYERLDEAMVSKTLEAGTP